MWHPLFTFTYAGSAPLANLSRGGDDRPRHTGWNRKRAELKLNEERKFELDIRDLYRKLTSSPLAERTEELVADLAPPIVVKGESEAARNEAIAERGAQIAKRLGELDRLAQEREIALRLLYQELREIEEEEEMIRVLVIARVI
jgi:hypothetical protein